MGGRGGEGGGGGGAVVSFFFFFLSFFFFSPPLLPPKNPFLLSFFFSLFVCRVEKGGLAFYMDTCLFLLFLVFWEREGKESSKKSLC